MVKARLGTHASERGYLEIETLAVGSRVLSYENQDVRGQLNFFSVP